MAETMPRFNHVAMSVAREKVLDPEWRREVAAFFSEVFGWIDVTYPPGDLSSLSCWPTARGSSSSSLPMTRRCTCPRMNHFGLEVATVAELEEVHRRAVAYRAKDARVDIVAPTQEVVGPFRLTSFYVGYLIPMMVEVQHFEELQ